MKVSNSQIQCFKGCRRKYEFQYIYNLQFTGETAEALEQGASYHACLEKLLIGEEYEASTPKIAAMVNAFAKYVLPNLPKMAETEKWFEYQTTNGHSVIGRLDGLTEDGFCVEHKTTSSDLGGEYLLELENDEQVLTYMRATGKTKIFYTVCKKPTIRQKQNETDEQYIDRCAEWYAEDAEHRIGVVEVERSSQDVADFAQQQDAIIDEMQRAQIFYKVPAMCYRYNRRCDFAEICNSYDPTLTYINYSTKESKREQVESNEI